jgi:GH18 family chitinase
MALAAQQGQREIIIGVVIGFLEQHPYLDGVSWDWQYPRESEGPERGGGSSTAGYTAEEAEANRANFVELMVGLGAALHAKVSNE